MTNLHKQKGRRFFSKVISMDSKQQSPPSRNDDDDKGVVVETAARPAWRQHGERRRRQLIDNDRALGGTCFRISNATQINKYFDLAERVTLQFYKLAEHLEHSAEDAYVIGHRVIAFLEDALPLHPQFSSENQHTAQRKAQTIRQQLETIAMYIDEQELNHWVEQEFDPQMEDDEEEEDDIPHQPTNKSNTNCWEPFFGWSSNRSIPDILETDESSLSMEEDLPKRTVVRDLILPQQEEPDDDSESTSSSEMEQEHHATLVQFRNSELLYDHEDDEDYDDPLDNENDPRDKQQDADTYGQWSIGKDFLKQIKAQKIEYETDSEAADSWAQDDTHTTATPPPPPVPHNSPRSDTGYYASYHHRQGMFGTTRDSAVRL